LARPALLAWAAPQALALGIIKISVIMTYSRQGGDAAAQMDNGMKLYMREKGETVAGRKIEPAASPPRSPSAWHQGWWCATRWTSSLAL
jgi:hypothetical protein